jgi:hypothetical protein
MLGRLDAPSAFFDNRKILCWLIASGWAVLLFVNSGAKHRLISLDLTRVQSVAGYRQSAAQTHWVIRRQRAEQLPLAESLSQVEQQRLPLQLGDPTEAFLVTTERLLRVARLRLNGI